MPLRTLFRLLCLPLLFSACSTVPPSMPDTKRLPNLVEMLCSCTNSEGQTMQEAARLYQEETGISWEEFLATPPSLTEDWVRESFFQDSLYLDKLEAIAEKAKEDKTINAETGMKEVFEAAEENYPFCTQQMRLRLLSILQ